MPISEAHVGRTYPATEPYEVTRGKIAEFATALGDTNPAYFGATPVAPPTFAVVLVAQAWDAIFADPELELSLQRVVHGDQGFRYVRPLRAGDEVTSTLKIDSVRVRPGSEWLGFSVEVRTTAGELVCTATSTMLHSRGVAA